MICGLPTVDERERALAVIEDVKARIDSNTLDRDLVRAVQLALLDFGKRYLVGKEDIDRVLLHSG